MRFITEIRTNFAHSAVEIPERSGGSIIQTVDGGAISVGPNSVALEILEEARLSGSEHQKCMDIFTCV